MSTSNQGRAFQNEITRTAEIYEQKGLLRLAKVDPPMRIVGTGHARKTIMLDNPFLDFHGAWRERGGRALCIEAKSTEKPTLGLCQSGGITENQWRNLQSWAGNGAACCVLWGYRGETRYVPLQAIAAQLRAGIKHLKWDNATVVPRGLGFVFFDWLQTLREYHPEKSC